MPLRDYRKKRRFQQTPEPAGGKASEGKARAGGPRFVVQQHQARRLHFDFRLEVDGVLKSWAVPKGPSLNPEDKRLAVMVEDHPLEYGSFEGVIPKGNYGAGAVMIWDQGSYAATDTADPKAVQAQMRQGLEDGKLGFILAGHKLNGEFALVKMRDGQWLLIKKRDRFASAKPLTDADRSVVSQRTLAEIAQGLDEPESSGKALSTRKERRPYTFSNEEKIYWPVEGIRKGDLIAYYREVAPALVPFLRDRPESMHRHPDGIRGGSFFHKDVTRQPPPSWVKTVLLPSESRGSDMRYLLVQDEPSLLYLANLGCIEIHPWHSRVGSLDKPDFVVIDLDPQDVPFAQVVETAQMVRRLLDKAGATCFCKTSGKRGMHIYVSLGARYDYDQAKQFAEIVARLTHTRLPDITSVARLPAQRRHRVYVDFLQNRRSQTVAAPYCVRPVPGAVVSAPLKWSEVTRRLDPTKFTMKTMPRRLDKIGDLWVDLLSADLDLSDCLPRLAKQLPDQPS